MNDERPPDRGSNEDDQKVASLKRFETLERNIDGANDEALAIKLSILKQEHSDLDSAIRALESQPHHDRLSVARLKKKKLHIKDLMQAISDQMTPDIIA